MSKEYFKTLFESFEPPQKKLVKTQSMADSSDSKSPLLRNVSGAPAHSTYQYMQFEIFKQPGAKTERYPQFCESLEKSQVQAIDLKTNLPLIPMNFSLSIARKDLLASCGVQVFDFDGTESRLRKRNKTNKVPVSGQDLVPKLSAEPSLFQTCLSVLRSQSCSLPEAC